jgi:tRNA modification GTPase
MYDVADTIVAVSSASGGVRSVIRLTGPRTVCTCEQVFDRSPGPPISNLKSEIWDRVILSGSVRVSSHLALGAKLYVFFAPRSYTGEDLAEIHVEASPAVVEALVQGLLAAGVRAAGPGEFTARAYLNGKLDLAQAEAVNEIVTSSNRLQLDAAERLLSGRLTEAADEIRSALLDVLSLIEAGLDFSTEDIELIGKEQVLASLETQMQNLASLLAGSIRYETLMDLPAVGIAGAPNAGKSSLLNALLGWERSIVSEQPKTTRDVLSGVLTTNRFQCVLFDCAGLLPAASALRVEEASPLTCENAQSCVSAAQALSPIDELAQRAAMEALQNCHTVLFCVDLAKSDWSEDIAIRALIQPRDTICIATKSDLLTSDELPRRMEAMIEAFDAGLLPVSAKTSRNLDSLLDAIEASLVGWALPTDSSMRRRGTAVNHPRPETMVGTAHRTTSEATAGPAPCSRPHEHVEGNVSGAAVTARHRQAIADAMESLRQATGEVERGNDEIAVTMIRAACQSISQIEQQHIDEQVLDRIFTRFCIGK